MFRAHEDPCFSSLLHYFRKAAKAAHSNATASTIFDRLTATNEAICFCFY